MHTLPTPQMVAWLRELGGTPDEAIGDLTLWELLLPLLMADIAVNEDYRYAPQAPLTAPLTVLGGVSDRRASPARLSEWQEQTSFAFRLRLLPDAHSAALERQEETLACIEGTLHQRLLPACRSLHSPRLPVRNSAAP
ncbi:thioesterase II family protein [Streptomyces solisilvae]|uniref:thioesterase II family protein n=1 Tax=Streptomyces malaysiensis TaxID=92644 RepID=UPI0036B72C4C